MTKDRGNLENTRYYGIKLYGTKGTDLRCVP